MAQIQDKKIMVIGFDTETTLMAIDNVVPKLICMTTCTQDATRPDYPTALLVPWEGEKDHIADLLIYAMESYIASEGNISGYDEVHLVGHYVAFDLSVLAMKYDKLLPYIFKWLDEDRIHDTKLRQQLINLTLYGGIQKIRVNGVTKHCEYHLSDLEQEYLNIDRTAQKEAADSCRMTYYLMDGKPIEEWPQPYITYAIEDAVNALKIYECQEVRRQQVFDQIQCDPFVVETFRVRVSFALRLLECLGSMVDKDRLLKIDKEISEEYMSPRLRDPLIVNRLLREAIAPRPHINGAIAHIFGCVGHKEHPGYTDKAKIKDCGCPPKMTKGHAESYDTKALQDYVLAVAKADPRVLLKPSDACRETLREKSFLKQITDGDGYFRPEYIQLLYTRQYTEDVKEVLLFSLDDEWQASYALLDPLLATWAERGKLKKMMTDYLPKLFYEIEGVRTPAPIIHAGYDTLKVTGRVSSYASKLYPSRNDQNVDPRIRACTIPRDGNCILSTDYSGMELGTLAQTCYNLFGRSVLRDLINAGVDVHAYMGAQIAFALDATFAEFIKNTNPQASAMFIYETFIQLQNNQTACDSPMYLQVYAVLHPTTPNHAVTWGDFFDHYRTFAKPTDLGYPGGLGAATFIGYAKGQYGVDVDMAIAKSLKSIWAHTLPQVPEYHKWISKGMIDYAHQGDTVLDENGNPKKVKYYQYNTPRGMHRSRCTFCQAANGGALQAPSAEGATDALYHVQKAVWLGEHELLSGVYPLAFIHDEILWESPIDDHIGERARIIEGIMIERMQLVTPDVTVSVETAAMMRWNKYAKPLWDGDVLSIWEPKKEVA